MGGVSRPSAAGTKLVLGGLGPGREASMGLGPLAARSVGYGQAGQVRSSVLGPLLGVGLSLRIPLASGYVSADLSVFPLGGPLVNSAWTSAGATARARSCSSTAASSSPWPIAFSKAASSGN